MSAPYLSMEGSWEEIAARLPEFAGKKLRVLVFPADEGGPSERDPRPISEVLAEIAGTLSAADLSAVPPDFCDQLDHYIYGAPKQ